MSEGLICKIKGQNPGLQYKIHDTSKILKTDYSFRKYTFYEYNASYFKSEIQNWDGIYKKKLKQHFPLTAK